MSDNPNPVSNSAHNEQNTANTARAPSDINTRATRSTTAAQSNFFSNMEFAVPAATRTTRNRHGSNPAQEDNRMYRTMGASTIVDSPTVRYNAQSQDVRIQRSQHTAGQNNGVTTPILSRHNEGTTAEGSRHYGVTTHGESRQHYISTSRHDGMYHDNTGHRGSRQHDVTGRGWSRRHDVTTHDESRQHDVMTHRHDVTTSRHDGSTQHDVMTHRHDVTTPHHDGSPQHDVTTHRHDVTTSRHEGSNENHGSHHNSGQRRDDGFNTTQWHDNTQLCHNFYLNPSCIPFQFGIGISTVRGYFNHPPI